jgi:hypothetical protein
VKLAAVPVVRTFYLAGGSAAALHLAHRESVDLDFFRADGFEPDAVGVPLQQVTVCRWDQYERDTVLGAADGIKISFFRYGYPLLTPLVAFEGLSVAAPLDLACMKLVAVGQRGMRRDFIDLRFLLDATGLDLWTLWQHTRRKFGLREDSVYWLARGLGYFEDAERESEPRMLKPFSWSDTRRFFQEISKRLLDRLR